MKARRETILEAQNRRLAALLDSIPDHLLLVDLAGRILYVNHAAAEAIHAATGTATGAIVGKDGRELGLPPPFIEQTDEERARVAAGARVTAEALFPTPKGGRWREHTMSPVFRDDGTIEGIAISSRDIHDRKVAQTRLQLLSKVSTLVGALEDDQVLAELARISIPELADWCIVDEIAEGGGILRARVAHRDPALAPLAEELHRFPPARRFRHPSAQVLLSGRSLLIADYSEEMAREQAQSPEHFEILRRMRPRSVLVVPLVVEGAVVRVTTFVMTAESGRRYGPDDLALAEELTRRAAQLIEDARLHQRLRESEARFRIALTGSPVTVFEQDSELRFRWIHNPQFGFRPVDLLGKTDADILPSDEAERLTAIKRRVLRTGEPAREEIRASTRGEVHQFLVALEPLRDPTGAIVGIAGASTDITAAKQVQEELARAVGFRDQMMAVLGHDLRNPLSAVGISTGLLLRREDLPEEVRRALARIDRAAARMVELIGTLLEFTASRVRGGLPISPVPTDLREVSRGVVEELLDANPGRTIRLTVRGDVRGEWDPARMAQVLSNLVGNALEHGAKEEPVQVSVVRQGSEVLVEVNNRGSVIPPELKGELFEPFRRGPTSEAASRWPRLGLGLYIARQIVLAHGGTIAVESTTEEGTTFKVRLPCREGRPNAERDQVVRAPGEEESEHHPSGHLSPTVAAPVRSRKRWPTDRSGCYRSPAAG